MTAIESKASRTISRRLEEIEPGTPRHEILETARRFKTSWVELGAKLWDVRQKKAFKEWGFDDFESYCTEEICIKPRTASKLTASFAFLKKEEPSVLKRDGIRQPVPEMQTVEVLRKAKAKAGLTEGNYQKIREMALEDAPTAEIRKELKQYAPQPEPPTADKIIRQLVSQAERLAEGLARVQGIPHVIVERALSLVKEIQALVKG